LQLEKYVVIKELSREDVEFMTNWGSHSNPLFLHYNFPKLSYRERNIWHHLKTSGIRKKCFAAINQNNDVIGYISMKRIDFFRRTSELGIVLDPAIVGEGYGPIALRSFLELYFGKLRMDKLNLKVAKFNLRALKAYKKTGFSIEGEIVEAFEEQEIEEALIKEISKENPYIFYSNGKIFCHYYIMTINRKSWFSPQKQQICG